MGPIILLMVLSIILILPFVWMRKPWAVKIWKNAKLIAVLYAAIILASGVARLIFNWNDIYG